MAKGLLASFWKINLWPRVYILAQRNFTFKIGNKMDIEVSNYYLHRAEIGNLTHKAINKILEATLVECLN